MKEAMYIDVKQGSITYMDYNQKEVDIGLPKVYKKCLSILNDMEIQGDAVLALVLESPCEYAWRDVNHTYIYTDPVKHISRAPIAHLLNKVNVSDVKILCMHYNIEEAKRLEQPERMMSIIDIKKFSIE